MKHIASLFLFFAILKGLDSQDKIPVFIDREGVMRWSDTNEEASFFGVNYTVPFAYGYRSHQALDMDIREAIRNDVYHLYRLGFNAFRVHLWDTEISDTLGNLLFNEHLELFDYLLYELKKKNIKTILTPLAFWGNGYPERDENTPGFSHKYGKGRATREESAIVAQENFLTQFFNHKNPYTKLRYMGDDDIIAAEINNEPSHGGDKADITEYINRLIEAVRNTGWKKPIFYNISQNPWCADAVAASKAEGFSFQWYPTGLVANRTRKGNFMQNVDHYSIPFGDTIEQYRNKPLMVYEFDAADILQSNLYPLMARSFREAGFQWATQFAYDPLATAYGNTEYQTHFVNLAYSPSKAISLMIASKVFRTIPRSMKFKDYPQDTSFGEFLVSYHQDLSLMNSETEYYYSNSTMVIPKNPGKLEHIAGVGESPIVKYSGTGAYFLDKVKDGNWRLEIMPDAVIIDDPFRRASPEKEVSRVVWRKQSIEIHLVDLGRSFEIETLTAAAELDSTYTTKTGKFNILPGIYLLSVKKREEIATESSEKLVAPLSSPNDLKIYHEPLKEASENTELIIEATVAGADSTTEIYALLNSGPWSRRRIDLREDEPYQYVGAVPLDNATAGILEYRIVINHHGNFGVFPGNIKKNPFAWDFHDFRFYGVEIRPKGSPIAIFDATRNRDEIMYYNPRWRENRIRTATTQQTGQFALQFNFRNDIEGNALGVQHYFGGKEFTQRIVEGQYGNVLVKAKNLSNQELGITVKLIDKSSNAFSYDIILEPKQEVQEIEIPVSKFAPSPCLQLPRPFPGFLELWHQTPADAKLNIQKLEKIEMISFADPESKDEIKVFEIVTISLIQ